MAKTLSFTDTSPQTVKIGDTTTSFTLICGNDNVATDLTKATSITAKLGNASGYLKSATVDPASLTDPTTGQVTVNFSPDLMTSLPAGRYAIEVWVVDSTGTSIYPSDGSIGFTIENNIESTTGNTITTIAFDDFVKEMNKAASTIANGEIADGSISPAKFDDSIKQNLFEYDTLDITPQQGFYSTFNKTFNSSADYLSITSACKPGELFSCNTKIKDSVVAVVMFFKDESCTQYHSHLLGGVVGTYNDYVFSIPEGVAGFAVTSTVDFSPVIKKCNPVAIKDFMQKTENQLSYIPPLSGELSNGFYSTINDIFNESTEYKSLKAKVAVGAKIFFNAVCSTNTVATCVFWDASGKKLLTLKGGEIGKWVNVEAVAPTNTAFVTITSTATNPPSATIQQPFDGEAVMEALPNVKPLMFNRKLDDRLEMLSKYNATQDLELVFGRVSTNNTWQFLGALLLDNTGKSVNSSFDRTNEDYINAFTDYVSPIYNLRAINNINGDQPDSWHYTGGWHGYDNANSGTATARTIGCKVFVDGFELGNEIVSGYETKLIITNLIQGTNTKKADGSGREILQEKITYTIVCGNVNIEAEYTALEDLTLNGYSFLQFQLVDRFGSKFIAYDDDSHRKWIDDFSSNIDGGDKTVSSTNCMQFTGKNDKCTMFYDPNFGLGKMQYNNSFKWHYRNYGNVYGKAYFDLINLSPADTPATFKSGEVFVCRGGYKFEAL